MNSAIKTNAHIPAARVLAVPSLDGVMSFLMLGGGSILVLVVLALLRSPLFVMNDAVRSFFQQVTGFTLFFVLLLSYPHFFFSYKFAYSQGVKFVIRNSWPLIGYPLLALVLLLVCLMTWNYPIEKAQLVAPMFEWLSKRGLNLNWSLYSGCGQMLMAALLVVQVTMSGYHFCLQSFGVTISCAQGENYLLSAQQKNFLRFNVYALWLMNLASGYTFFTMFDSRNFAYHPFQLPAFVLWLSGGLFVISVGLLFTQIIIPNARQQNKWPSLLAVLPLVSVWLWLQPFFQPFGYQIWVVPLAHGAQYLYFAYKVESKDFDRSHGFRSGESRSGETLADETPLSKTSKTSKKAVCMVFLGLVAAGVSYVAFVGAPVALGRAGIFPETCPNFMVLAAFVFLTTHHYMIDTVVWQKGSRTKELLVHG